VGVGVRDHLELQATGTVDRHAHGLTAAAGWPPDACTSPCPPAPAA